MIIERSEEGHSQAAIRHGIQQTMAGGGQKEVRPQRDQAKPGQAPSKSYKQPSTCKESREKKGVGESAMAPEVTVKDAESESDNIKIGNHRADSASNPDSSRHARAVEARTNAEGCNRMRKRRCHPE